MGKLKIGTRVRDSGDDEGVIVEKRKGERLVKYDYFGSIWVPKPSLKPVNDNTPASARPEVCDYAYKVGDLVRFIRENPNGGGAYGRTGEEFVVSSLDAGPHEGEQQVEIKHPKHGFDPSVPLSAIELVGTQAAPPLTIEAGKFYRTRDGRKVGPTSRLGSAGWPWKVPQFGVTYADNGVHLAWGEHTGEDIVTEWVDLGSEQTAAATTFSVGDHVAFTENCPSGWWFGPHTENKGGVITRVGEGSYYKYRVEIGSKPGFVDDEHIVLIEPSAPQPKFAVGDKIDYGTVCTDWNGATITEVFAEPDGQFLYRGRHPTEGFGMFLESEIRLHAPLPSGSTVTFTASGRLSAINENGHYQVTFPGLPPSRNSFALPSEFVTLAN